MSDFPKAACGVHVQGYVQAPAFIRGLAKSPAAWPGLRCTPKNGVHARRWASCGARAAWQRAPRGESCSPKRWRCSAAKALLYCTRERAGRTRPPTTHRGSGTWKVPGRYLGGTRAAPACTGPSPPSSGQVHPRHGGVLVPCARQRGPRAHFFFMNGRAMLRTWLPSPFCMLASAWVAWFSLLNPSALPPSRSSP